MFDLTGSTRQPAQIYYERETHVPAVFERFMRYSPGFDGTLATVCAPGPVKAARLCGGGGSRGRYMRRERRAHISEAEKSFRRTP